MGSPEFEEAVVASAKLKAKPSNEELLLLYAYFKQARQDPPIENAETPGTFDLKGKAKKKAWQKIVDEGITPQQAEEKYVALVNQLKDKHGYDPNKQPEKIGGQS